jgi:hypothetical protein
MVFFIVFMNNIAKFLEPLGNVEKAKISMWSVRGIRLIFFQIGWRPRGWVPPRHG